MAATGGPSLFLDACRRRPTPRPPVWFMRQAGRYMKDYRDLRAKHSILELAKTPELACAVTLQPVRRFGFDAAILFSDILLPLEPMGARLRFAPAPVIDNPVRSARDAARLRPCAPREDLSRVLKAVSLLRRELGRTPLIGFVGAPFTLASYLIEGGPSKDFIRTKAFMNSEPDAWAGLMRRLSRMGADYLSAQVEAGCRAVQVFDSWAGALSPAQYRGKVLPYSRALIAAAQKSGAPVIHFGTGTAGFLRDFASAGSDVVGVDWRVDLAQAFKICPGRAVQGNLDPAVLAGPLPALKKEAAGILRAGRGRRGFIFNLGHGVLPQTPEANVRAVVELIRRFGRP
ncbi:MAG: uroporphyrinogen decarboxylase [Elusimicrobia bacterium]|nr:uroporphyrinogen decarboxylase [Elusimicrobiota bacterium]